MIRILTLQQMFLSIFFALVFFSVNLTGAYESPRFQECGVDADKYTNNSLFAANLAHALNNIRTYTAHTGFNTTTVENGTEPVTALGFCRPDQTPMECQACIDSATSGILEVCLYQKTAQIWYNLCMIRYSFMDFLSLVDRTPIFSLWTDFETQSSDVYYQTLLAMVKNLSSLDAVSKRRYAVGWSRVNEATKVYGYAQCTPDLSGESCSSCLVSCTEEMNTYCRNKWACWSGMPSCSIMFDRYPIFNQSIDTPEILLNLPSKTDSETQAEEAPKTGRRGRSSMVIGVSGAVVGTVILVVAAGWMIMKGRHKTNKGQRRGSGDEEDAEESIREGLGMRNFLYDMEALVAATDNFSSANRLGGGGFGFVYKGRMHNGEEIAVKKLTVGSTQGVEEFSNEVEVLVKMRHRNLVKLLGCCTQGDEKMLVYEYLPNKSLNYFLFDKSRSALLDWQKRSNIMVGVARGLLYLHEDSQIRIIHRDIKTSNILLDEHMNPKISDFGLAKLFPDEQSHLRTRRIAGTVGYMAPEYAIRGLMSTKIDVFSFGVLMLEIISGRKNYDPQLDDQRRELLNLTHRLERQGRLMELVDTTIGSFPEDEVKKCIHIGLLCCQDNMQERLTMSSALMLLLNNPVTMPPPGRLGFQGSRENTNESSTSHTGSSIVLENENVSNNTMTTSLTSGHPSLNHHIRSLPFGDTGNHMANWELKKCCNHEQVVFLTTISICTVVILAAYPLSKGMDKVNIISIYGVWPAVEQLGLVGSLFCFLHVFCCVLSAVAVLHRNALSESRVPFAFLWRTILLTPFKLVTVFLHEASHAIACKLTCGHVEGIQVHADEGGTTQTRGGIYWLILPAGYLGSSFWGMVLIIASTNVLTAKIAAGCFAFALLVVLFVAKNWTLRGLCIGFIILIAVVWLLQETTEIRILRCNEQLIFSLWYGLGDKAINSVYITIFSGVTNDLQCASTDADIYDDLISRRVNSSDAEKFAEVCPCPCNGVGWGVIWGLISFLFLCGAMYLGLVILS
ncbi:Cysteine-rich receptor-like protein kinase 25 [Vitis vinifera]|uniref:Cysteine-rich receptor-like protein kinase 25 n=1 Tax=Vitis vinifera TaxID=29760 RepID=A0A438JYF5_VITVI|nr:Cysteine-rich receptor-like protein kinase 25 [Vitis vinifera]